ncbi:MAG: hypothetical protein Fur0018_04920 [Anaerolineales bacterium]
MNHQPFETWILADEPLNWQERISLENHLSACDDCRTLSTAWQEMNAFMRTAPTPQPAPGFSARFQARLEAQQARHNWHQAWLLILLYVGGMLIITGFFLAFLLLALHSPVDFIIAGLHQSMRLIVLLKAIADTCLTLAAFLPPAWWLGILETLVACVLLWLCSLRKLIPLWRVVQ